MVLAYACDDMEICISAQTYCTQYQKFKLYEMKVTYIEAKPAFRGQAKIKASASIL